MFGQTFGPQDLLVLGALVVLEGLLSVDNALVLALLAQPLPRHLRGKALFFGLAGAFVFRTAAVFTAGWLLRWRLPRLLGGVYLIYIAVRYFVTGDGDVSQEPAPGNDASDESLLGKVPGQSLRFWRTVLFIELTDIAFAVDSIVAALAMISATPRAGGRQVHPKLWLVVAGGMLGVILIRFAANGLISVIERFPRLQTSAYLLVLLIGGKLALDYAVNSGTGPPAVDFQSASSPAFWAFWLLMMLCLACGFLGVQKNVASK